MIRVNMATPVTSFAFGLFLFASSVVALQHKCADVNTKACVLMAQSNPNLCSDNTLAEAACPRFCQICPIEYYHCDTTLTNVRGCNTTKVCAQHQLCDGGGLTLAFGKRGLEVRDVSITCCHDDRCNYPATTTSTAKTPISQTAPWTLVNWFNLTTHPSGSPCKDIIGPEQCRFLTSSFAVCSNFTVANKSGCLASCGYCGLSMSTSTLHSTPPSTPTSVRTTTATATPTYRDCLDIYKDNNKAPSGAYTVTLTNATGAQRNITVWCDMEHGGGWTVFQKRFNGSVDFYKGFASYQYGFGNVNGGEFWQGLLSLHLLTTGSVNTLRVDVINYAGNHSFEEYGDFSVGPGPGYRLHVDQRLNGTTDGHMKFYDGADFSTYDRDVDTFKTGSCADRYHGAFWYKGCMYETNVNGMYKPGLDRTCQYYAMTYNDCTGNRAMEMKFKRSS